MKRILVSLLTCLFFSAPVIFSLEPSGGNLCALDLRDSDTLVENQILYKGRIWRNLYRRIEGDQYFVTDAFMTGSVSIEGKRFDNVPLKYDIFFDEIITTTNKDIIIVLNKEMIDSFTVSYLNKVHHFKSIKEDSSRLVSGYVDILYNGNVSLYVKYMKKIDPVSALKEYDNFYQAHKIYLDNKGSISLINKKKDILRIFENQKQQIKDYIRKNKLRIRKEIPESFVAVVEFCNTLEN